MATFQEMIFGALIFTAVLMMGIYTYTSIAPNYSLDTDGANGFYQNVSKIDQFDNVTRDMEQTFEETKTDSNSIDSSIVGGFRAIKKATSLIDTSIGIFKEVARILKIPAIVITAILIAILTGFMAAILTAFLGRPLWR